MATRSLIGIQLNNEVTKIIFCHYDGYPSGVGQMLVNNYNTSEIVDELIELGDLSALGETLDSCVAYHRDRNEPWGMVEPREIELNQYCEVMNDYNAEYIYVHSDTFRFTGWECFDNKGNQVEILADEA